jgi:hypothetical protein
MSMIAGLLALPFLVWSWLRHDNQEDGDLAVGVIGVIVLSATAAGLVWFALG